MNMLDALANPVGMIIFAFVMVQAALSDLTTMQILKHTGSFFSRLLHRSGAAGGIYRF